MKSKKYLLSIFHLYTLIASLFFFAGCKETPAKKNKPVPPAERLVTYTKPASSFTDTLTINVRAAVFYNPDSDQLQRIKAVKDLKDFSSDEHNCFYLMRNARMVLKKYWPSVQIIEISKARFLHFIRPDKTSKCIDLDRNGDMCGVYLFDRKKEPELADMMNIDTALEFYFHK
jgi:hypothetical protein